MNKQVANVVFYKFNGETGEMQQACIFYNDGTVKNVTYAEGLEIVSEIAEKENLTSEDLTRMINKKRVYTLPRDEFEKRYEEFLGKGAERSMVPVSPVVMPTGTNVPTQAETIASAAKKETVKKKKKGIFKKTWAKVTAGVVAAAMIVGGLVGAFFLGRNSKSGDIINNNISSETHFNDKDLEIQDLAYAKLLDETTNVEQKNMMAKQSESLDLFNRDFASAYIEEGKEIKAALTWDEMMALNIAYNTYTKEQIKIMFNGAEVNAIAMSNAYKTATLQLMGAYVIETRENPVNSSQFLNSEEEQAFVEKYNDLFLKCKEMTGEEQVAAINAFYAELYKDFPIADEVREEGLAHSDPRTQLMQHKLAVTPIVAASEILFQNRGDIDHSLSDKAVAYFNDLGLCNLADAQFERAATITLSAETDETTPLYEDYRTTKINELILEDNYVIDDAHRELSQLTLFQELVNGHAQFVEDQNANSSSQSTTTTTTETKTESTTNTETSTIITDSREEAIENAGEAAVEDAEKKAEQEMQNNNDEAAKLAEQEAEKARQEQQAAADEEKKAQQEEVDKKDNAFQEQVDDANNNINNGGTVNEGDFGDNDVDFDEQHSDNNGNLNDSVTDITTDGTGDQTDETLPDPNQTGAEFDSSYSEITGTPNGSSYNDNHTNDSSNGSTYDNAAETYENTSGQEIYEYEEPYVGGLSNEEIVDAYIASLEGQGEVVVGHQYSL